MVAGPARCRAQASYGDAYGHPDGAPTSYVPAIADVDGNGTKDVVVAVSNGNALLWPNDGSGTLGTVIVVPLGGAINAITVADVNEDGIADLIGSGSNGMLIAFGSGGGAYAAPSVIASGGTNANAMIVVDINDDGHLDALVSNAGASGSDNGIGVLLGHGDGTFAAATAYAAGAAPGDLQWVDVTGDGVPDLCSIDGNDGSLWTRQGATNGTFGAPHAIATDGRNGVNVGGLALADLDGDGHRDMILARPPVARLAIALGAAGGIPGPQVYDVGGSSVTGLVAYDFTGDGVVDVLLGGSWKSTFRLLRGTGGGALATATLASSPRGPRSAMAGADLNDDGLWDAVAGSGQDSYAVALLGDGAGNFSAVPEETPSNVAYVPAIGDLNGDGVPDVIFSAATNALIAMLGVGDGSLGPPQASTTSSTGAGVALGDFDGDGHLDAAVASQGSDSVEILLGHQDGTFAAPTIHTVPSSPMGLAVADFDGDGHLDVAVTSYGANSVSVLLGRGDGTLAPAQPVDSSITNSVAVVVSDIDGDGRADLLALDGANVGVQLHLLLGDGDGDGSFATPLVYGTSATTMATLAVADMDADGRPDVVVAAASLQVLLNGGCLP